MSEKTRYSFKTKEEIASEEEVTHKKEESPKTPTGYIGLFWIDQDNEILVGVKRDPVRLGMTGPDGIHENDLTIIDYSHTMLWRHLMADCAIPDHVLKRYKSNVGRRFPQKPKGRVAYNDQENTFIASIDHEYVNNEKVIESIRKHFNLQTADLVIEDEEEFNIDQFRKF